MNSMTGFGKSEFSEDGRNMCVEMRSVNHRFLDLSIHAPRALFAYEDAIRSVLKSKLARGHVDVYITCSTERQDAGQAIVDMSLAEAYLEAASRLESANGVRNDVTTSVLLQIPDLIRFEMLETESKMMGELALRATEQALLQLCAARAREGADLWEDISKRIEVLRSITAELKASQGAVVDMYAQRLRDRIDALKPEDVTIAEQRLAQEIALFADRCDVTEELIRIGSELDRLTALGRSMEAQGRNMGFTVQELNREFNTIGSKTQSTDFVTLVLNAKAEVEKIREQVQNIE